MLSFWRMLFRVSTRVEPKAADTSEEYGDHIKIMSKSDRLRDVERSYEGQSDRCSAPQRKAKMVAFELSRRKADFCRQGLIHDRYQSRC